MECLYVMYHTEIKYNSRFFSMQKEKQRAGGRRSEILEVGEFEQHAKHKRSLFLTLLGLRESGKYTVHSVFFGGRDKSGVAVSSALYIPRK